MGSLIGASGGMETLMTELLTPSRLAISQAEISSWCHPTGWPRSIVVNLRLGGMFVCALLSHPIYTFFSPNLLEKC